MVAAIRDIGPEQRPFRPQGTGWIFEPPGVPIRMHFDRVTERSGDTWAEVHVKTLQDEHLARRRVNLLGGTSFNTAVKELNDLTDGSGWNWQRLLNSGCESTLEAFRAGEPMETYEGEVSRPPGIRWLCQGLVMAGVVNCWVAAAATGKSTFAASLCVHHALGMPFLDRETTKGVPLYLDWESDADDFREKLHDVSRWLGVLSVPRIHRWKMRGPLKARVNELARRIDEWGVTLIVVDAVASAGGSMGEGNYEAVAIDLEQALIALPPGVTVLLLDHISSDDFKTGGVVYKARGAQRKYEFVRQQWTITLDRERAEDGNHVVGWTHTKINRGRFLQPFGVEILHRDGELGFREVETLDVQPVADRMPQHRRLAKILERTGPLEVKEIALEMLGRGDDKACNQIRALFYRDHGKAMHRLPDGRLAARNTLVAPQHPSVADGPDLRLVDRNNDRNKDEYDELPF